MKTVVASMGIAGIVLMGQQAAPLLDKEFNALSPDLLNTIGTVEQSMTQGFSATQIALATIALPLAFQGMKMMGGVLDTLLDGRKDKREQGRLEFESKLRLNEEAQRLRIQREHAMEAQGLAPTPPTPPLPLQ